MTEAIAPGLLITAISAVVFVAYRHPNAFARLYLAVGPIIRFGILTTIAWGLGDSEARRKIRLALPTVLSNDRAARESLRLLLDDAPPFGWILLGLAVTFIFLEALSALPRWGIVGGGRDGSTPSPTTPSADRPRIEGAVREDERT